MQFLQASQHLERPQSDLVEFAVADRHAACAFVRLAGNSRGDVPRWPKADFGFGT